MFDPNAAARPGEGVLIDGKTWKQLLKPVKEFGAEAPPKLGELIHRCLEWNPHQRPERMSEVQGALDHLADELVRGPDDKLEAFEW
jgi:hypothetical protein